MNFKSKISSPTLILTMAAASFLSLIIIVSFYNRFAIDDYFHINNEQRFGIWGGMLEGYYNWGGRWSSYLLWNIVFHFHNIGFVLYLFSLSTVLFFVFSIFYFLKSIDELWILQIKKKQLLLYSLLFTAFFFQISFNKGEIWFWVVSTCMYLTSISTFLLGISLMFSKKSNLFSISVMVLCIAFAGGASEIYALFYITILTGLLISFYIFRNNKNVFKLKETASWKIHICLAFLLAAFILSFLAPGNSVRQTWLPEPSFSKALLVTFKSLGKILLFKFSVQVPWIVLFSLPFLYLGNLHKKENTTIKNIVLLKKLMVSALALLLILYILMFPACYILSEIGPDRSLSLTILAVTFFCAYWSFKIGRTIYFQKKILKGIFYFSTVAIFVSFSIQCFQQFQITSNYAEALDKRVEYLIQLQKTGNNKTITVDSLPPSGYLHSAEISSDTNYFGNDHFQKGLFLDFKVKIKK